MSVLGEQIKKYRIRRNITQEELGERVGVTMQAVSRWERGGAPVLGRLYPHRADTIMDTEKRLHLRSRFLLA